VAHHFNDPAAAWPASPTTSVQLFRPGSMEPALARHWTACSFEPTPIGTLQNLTHVRTAWHARMSRTPLYELLYA
jgi:hypothetical protein